MPRLTSGLLRKQTVHSPGLTVWLNIDPNIGDRRPLRRSLDLKLGLGGLRGCVDICDQRFRNDTVLLSIFRSEDG